MRMWVTIYQREAARALTAHQVPYFVLDENKTIVKPDEPGLSEFMFVLNPKTKPDQMSWPIWQVILKKTAKANQKDVCANCKRALGLMGELHHALITRQDVRGVHKYDWLIHHTFNVLVLCYECHIQAIRITSFANLCDLYGPYNITKWYEKFPYKIGLASSQFYQNQYALIAERNKQNG